MSTRRDLDLIRDALSSSTLSHGLKMIGDRWTMQILMGAFLGIKRFDAFRARLGIPPRTLSDRLKLLVHMDLMRARLYQERPERYAYHLTRKGMAIYEAVLMVWEWERRFGDGALQLPARLVHARCGHAFMPQLTCEACGEPVTLRDLELRLRPNPRLPHDSGSGLRTPRISAGDGPMAHLALRLDRWSLMIVSAVILGCRHFDELVHVLRITPPLLSRRLAALAEAGLLRAGRDRADGRRRVYLLTPASRALFGYVALVSTWASEHLFREPSSIRPRHRACGRTFVPRATCSHCHGRLQAWEVGYQSGEAA